MAENLFSLCRDRSRLDLLEHEIAWLALDLLKTYMNEDNEVHRAFLTAGKSIYSKQYWCMHAYQDFILAETERLLGIAKKHDGAWNPEPGTVERQIEEVPCKQQADVDEIEVEIIALSTRFEDMGYQPIEIGRALATVGLTFAPVGFVELENWVCKRSQEGRDERERAFLDECLGKDRYPDRSRE